MTWRGDGGSEGLRTIVPPIVDRLVSFGMALRESGASRSPRYKIWYAENCAKSSICTQNHIIIHSLRSRSLIIEIYEHHH